MNENIKEIQDNFSDFNGFSLWIERKEYSDKSISTLSRGELREALSLYLWEFTPSTLITSIITSIVKNVNQTWELNDLTLVDVAVLQKLLRDQGYELDMVDHYPTSTDQLIKLLNKSPLGQRIKNLYYNIIKKIKTFYHYYLILMLAGLMYFNNWSLLLLSLLITYVSWTFLEIAKHDYLEHNNIAPKNLVMKYIIDIILYITSPMIYVDKSGLIKLHVEHHKYWKTEKDAFSYIVGNELVVGGAKSFNPIGKPNPENFAKLLKEYPQAPWLIKYLREFEIVLAILFVANFGVELFFYAILLPLILKPFLESQHDWYIIKFGERNYWFLFPLTWNQSWHYTHHTVYGKKNRSWDDIFFGPRWVRYINPQYYFARLFFKLN